MTAATSSERETARRALAALRAWPAVSGFPYAEVVAHYRCAGRARVSGVLTGELRRVHTGLTGLGPGRPWPLRDWLPSAIDQHGGDYDSYLATPLLDAMTGRRADDLVLALTADLASTEACALLAGPRDRDARQRTRAVLAVLARLTGPAARADLRRVADDDDRLGEAAAKWTGAAAELVSGRARFVTGLSMLPITQLHDEQMFIRSLQIFEIRYRQTGAALRLARDALCRLDPGQARGHVAEALGVLRLLPVLFRVVTTMPRQAFAIIREHTVGRSAIQSRAFRFVEAICAPRPPRMVTARVPEPTVIGPTVQDALRVASDRLGHAAVAGVAGLMVELDEAWRAMKRTHWGITLKVIGTVPGTGGTSGADYLRAAAAVPLFPALARSGVPGSRTA